MSRGWCLFLAVDCHAVPRKRRADFVATAVRRTAPFAEPGWRVAWAGGHAMVWTWPQDQLTNLDPELGARAATPQRFLPETLLRGTPTASGVELVRCCDGVEARAWRDRNLAASNWWPGAPALDEWEDFCRGAGFEPQAMPPIAESPWREEPWTTSTRDLSLNVAVEQAQRLVIPAIGALVVLLAAYQVGALARLGLAGQVIAGQIARDSAAVSDVLDQRNHAEDDLAAIGTLLALRPPVPQVDLMTRVGELLDKQHARIVRWSMPDPASLQVTVSTPDPNPRALVLAFQQTGLFSDVGANTTPSGANELIIHARVTGKRERAPKGPA